MFDILLSFIMGLIGGILSAWIFLLIVTNYYRPKIIISNKIAFEKSDKSFWFKLVNLTKRDIYEIGIFLDLRKIVSCSNNKYHSVYIKSIELRKNFYPFVPKKSKIKEKIDLGEFCLQISTLENLFNEINKDHYILTLQIVAKDSKSGLSKSFNQTFDKNSIEHGEFLFGENLEIKQANNP